MFKTETCTATCVRKHFYMKLNILEPFNGKLTRNETKEEKKNKQKTNV